MPRRLDFRSNVLGTDTLQCWALKPECEFEVLFSTEPWSPKVCKIMAFHAIFGAFGLLFYILLEPR